MAKQITELLTKSKAAKRAANTLSRISTGDKNIALNQIADALDANEQSLIKANSDDLNVAQKSGSSDAFLSRLSLTSEGISYMADGVRSIAKLPDPVGEEFDKRTLPNGIKLSKRRVPLGVIGSIFEARPEVPIDISALCIKSGNSVVLRGSKEAVNTNKALGLVIRSALSNTKVPLDVVQVIETTDRKVVGEMLKLNEYFDLIIPRGGAELVRYVANEATMPAITGGIGVCHTYIDYSVNVEDAIAIIINAKAQAPAKCNALDTLIIHRDSANEVLSKLAPKLERLNVEMRCDPAAYSIASNKSKTARKATSQDWGTEFLDLILSIKIVENLGEAILHIENYGSGHSEAIITSDSSNAKIFVDQIDASVVLVNASTRFNDGAQFGLGAEVAISTNKFHARGPMGLKELTSYKWIALGNGHTRD